ncbi:TrgA family protein [Yoonia sp.]|uniref:TrgA family protein n=1 Tax=Yoonia sp. TaxID=2212373 RepID=UPI0039189E54
MTISGRRNMPTAAKLAGAVVYGLGGWYVAVMATPFFLDGIAPMAFLPAAILIGLYLGWAYVGARTGQGYVAAVGHGVTAAVAFSFMLLFVTAFSIMITRAMRLQYDGPMDRLVSVFGIMVTESQRFMDIPLLATILLGAIICALFAEFIGRRYP